MPSTWTGSPRSPSRERARTAATLRCVYLDLDGTLLGAGASLLHDGTGAFSLSGARALEACHRAGVEVVLNTGRSRTSVAELARLIGARSFIYEVGCAVVIDGEGEFLTNGLQPGARTIYEQIADSGAPALLLEHYAGCLEYHAPWHRGREVSHPFRGQVDLGEAQELLRCHGVGWLRLIDNGVIPSTTPRVAPARDYHLIPAGSSKGRAMAHHMAFRGYAPEECIAVGDSRQDLEAASVVGSFWLVANALEQDTGLFEAVATRPNVRVSTEGYGRGVYEAVTSSLR